MTDAMKIIRWCNEELLYFLKETEGEKESKTEKEEKTTDENLRWGEREERGDECDGT